MQFKSLLDKVVVITGASSGIGKLAVEEFLAQGAKVVLAARSEDAMQDHLNTLGVKSDRAVVVKTDVSVEEDVEALAQRAVDQFGHIDIWVNNAAVSIYSPVEFMSMAEIRRVIDVNLIGQIHGMRAALKVFEPQGFGNLINVASALGKGSSPLQSAYVATKHGIVGFSSVLREELMSRRKDNIEVSVILPSSMDTPLFVHAKSKTGRLPKPIPPVYDPQMTVNAILNCALNPKPEVIVGGGGKTMVWAYRLAPQLLEWYMGRTGIRNQTTEKPKPMEGNDNLFEPMPGAYDIRGGIGTTGEHVVQYVKQHPLRMAVAAMLPVLLTYSWMARRRAA